MKTGRTYKSIVTATLAMAFTIIFFSTSPAQEKGSLRKVDGIYVLELEGSPYEIGFQHGSLMKEQIKDVYEIYLNALVYDTWIKEYAILGKGGKTAWSNPRKALGVFAKKMEKYIPDEYIQEMKGIADGAGLSYIDVINMTAHVDYFAILCSTLVANEGTTTDGKLIEARNLDWAQGGVRELDKYSTVFVVKPDNGRPFVSVMYPGLVGVLTAVNDSKLTAELNFSMAKENGEEGIPGLILMRQLIQHSSNLDEAEKIIRDASRFAGYNIMLTDGKTNDARLVEVSAGPVGSRNISGGMLVSTNHFITEELAGGNIETSNFSSSPSEDRFNRLTELLAENQGSVDHEKAIKMIHDDMVRVSGTVQTVIFKPADNLIWVWARNRAEGDFVKFDVGEMLGGVKTASE